MLGQDDGSAPTILTILTVDLIADIGQGYAGKITAAAAAAHHHIRINADFLHLFLCFQADDRLIKQHVI